MSPSSRRAWIEILRCTAPVLRRRSPSSRRAWIEIQGQPKKRYDPPVALLAEGVDRNYEVSGKLTQGTWSPSSRRAWIEIKYL